VAAPGKRGRRGSSEPPTYAPTQPPAVEDQAGLAAALITASFQLGSAHGLAVFSGIATSPTSHLLAAHTPPPEALTAGIQRARGRPQNTELCVINDATETDAKACRSKTSFASNGSRVFLVVRGTVFFVVRRRGRRVGTGPGVACPKSRRSGCEPAALAAEPFPGCPPDRLPRRGRRRPSGACRCCR
jgi:hypothetical protein